MSTVTTKRVSIRVETLKRVAAQTPALQKKLEDEYRRFVAKDMERVFTDHYQEAINQAASVIGKGIPGAGSSVSATVKTRFGSVALGMWAALSSKYRNRKSRVAPGTESLFWKFSGSTGMFLLKLAVGVKSAALTGVKASYAGQSSVRIGTSITAPFSGDPTIDGLMRQSFVQGAPRFIRADSSDKALTPAGVVAVTESRRPLLSQLAAVLGMRAKQAISKM